MVVKFDKNDSVSLYIRTSRGNYFFWIDNKEVVPLIKRLSTSKDGKVKVADKDYGVENGLKKFFEIKLDSKEDCKKLANELKTEWDYFTGKKKRPYDEKFILPWKRTKE